MLLRAVLRSARPSTSRTRLSAGPLHPTALKPLHFSTALPAKKRPVAREASRIEGKSPAEWKRLNEIIEEQDKLGYARFSRQNISSPKTEWPCLENVAAALLLPIPTELPPLPPALDQEVFRVEDTPSQGTPHLEILEWVGDRELNSVAAQVLVVLAPDGFCSKQLKWHSAGLAKLMTNKAAAAFAKQLGMDRRFAASTSQETLADRFESYVGALWACNGSSAVLEFLAPLFGRMLNVVLDDVKEVAEAEPIMDPAAAATTPKPTSELKEGKSTLTTPVTKAKALYTAPLSYVTFEDAKTNFVEDLKNGGWERYFTRGKRSMNFFPPKQKAAYVRFQSKEQDGLSKLLLRAAEIGSVVIKSSPLPAVQKITLNLNAPDPKPSKAEGKAQKKAEVKIAATSATKAATKAKSSAPKIKSKKPKLSLRGEIAKTGSSQQKKLSAQVQPSSSAKLSSPSSSTAPSINPAFFL